MCDPSVAKGGAFGSFPTRIGPKAMNTLGYSLLPGAGT